MKNISLLTAFFAALASAHGAVGESEAARLGQDLTPLGAEAKGNADGTIPAWDGGIKSAPAGYKVGDHHPDPFAGDQPRFTITAASSGQYAAQLTAGQLALFKAYPDYKLIVYPTRRSASNPQNIYDATKKNATTGKLVDGGNGITGAVRGAPFPIPGTGLEVVWNFLTRYRGVAAVTITTPTTTDADGNTTPWRRSSRENGQSRSSHSAIG